jgi:aspartyl/asparaginyl-tRNA synthetase
MERVRQQSTSRGYEVRPLYVTGMQNIRDVIPFARVPGSAEF